MVGRVKTSYEIGLENELEARKTRQLFIRQLAVLNVVQFAAIMYLIFWP